MSKIRISVVPCEMLSDAWPCVMQLVDKALLQGDDTHNLSDVLQSLMQGESVLWISEQNMNITGVAITEVVVYPRKRALRIWLLAGENFSTWKDFGLAHLEGYARDHGCHLLEFIGRPGWLKKHAKALGFEAKKVTFSKKVDLGTH